MAERPLGHTATYTCRLIRQALQLIYLQPILHEKQSFKNPNPELGSREYEFAEPMVFDLIGRLGAIPGQRETKYLMIISLNGDSIEFVPEVEMVYAQGAAMEIEIPIIR